jgi:hypothetical protein
MRKKFLHNFIIYDTAVEKNHEFVNIYVIIKEVPVGGGLGVVVDCDIVDVCILVVGTNAAVGGVFGLITNDGVLTGGFQSDTQTKQTYEAKNTAHFYCTMYNIHYV